MIKVGCCGFPVRRATYYETFPVVEIQQTFYQLPELGTAKRWRESAPSGFEFTMKAWQLITHEPSSPTYRRLKKGMVRGREDHYGFFKPTEEVRASWLETAAFAEALGAEKIVFQTPASFGPTKEHVQNLRSFFTKLRGGRFVLIWEPRGKWVTKQVEGLCRELGIFPCLDPFQGPPSGVELFYVRLHGRKGYRSSYTDEELAALLEKARAYPASYLLFNNVSMFEDAKRFKRILEGITSGSAGDFEMGGGKGWIER